MSWLFNDESDKYHCDVRLVPMCSCGHVFTEGINIVTEKEYLEALNKSSITRIVHRIDSSCPMCGRMITTIKIADNVNSDIIFKRSENELNVSKCPSLKKFDVLKWKVNGSHVIVLDIVKAIKINEDEGFTNVMISIPCENKAFVIDHSLDSPRKDIFTVDLRYIDTENGRSYFLIDSIGSLFSDDLQVIFRDIYNDIMYITSISEMDENFEEVRYDQDDN